MKPCSTLLLAGIFCLSSLPVAVLAEGEPAPEPTVINSPLATYVETHQTHFNRIDDRYVGYTIHLQNKGPYSVTILNTVAANRKSGQEVFQECKINTTGRALGYGVGLGLLTFGAGALVGFGNAAFNSGRNRRAEAATVSYDNSLPLGTVASGGELETRAFVPLGQKPKLNITYQDEVTHQTLYFAQ